VVAGTFLWQLKVEAAILTVLRGVAAGNLLYQSVYELLTREVRERAMGLLSLFACLLGFLVILFLQMIGGYLENTKNIKLS
jgi:zinc transporter ZupT